MSQSESAIQPLDLIRELSDEALNYFAELMISHDWSTGADPLSGKFVRLGDVIVIGAQIELVRPDHPDGKTTLKHRDLRAYALHAMGQTVLEKIKDSALPEATGYLADFWPIKDAGHTLIGLDAHNRPARLYLAEYSFDFGAADNAGRQQTAEIARQVLGRQITVSLA